MMFIYICFYKGVTLTTIYQTLTISLASRALITSYSPGENLKTWVK